MSDSVKVGHGALDEVAGGDIILRGVIDPGCLHLLQVPEYQREVLPLASINELVAAFMTGSVPDIELGMRGEHFIEREGFFYLQDPTFIIDGLQRVSAAMLMMKIAEGKTPRLGAAVHFGTTEKWERERFSILNADRTKLSPNILLRNMRHNSPCVDMIHSLTHDKQFVMNGRVTWSQRMRREELLTALTFLKTIGTLHSRFGPGLSLKINELVQGLDKIMKNVGRNIMRDNIKTFFDVIDQCWGIRTITFKEGSVYLRGSFLSCLARIFSRYQNFWRESRLFVEMDLVRKIKLFPVGDPTVVQLASANGKAREMLYMMLLRHINSGKRTRRLQLIDGMADETVGSIGIDEQTEVLVEA